MHKITSPEILEVFPEEIWKLIDGFLSSGCEPSVCYRGKYRPIGRGCSVVKNFYNFLGVSLPPPEKIIYNSWSAFQFRVFHKYVDRIPHQHECGFERCPKVGATENASWVYIITQISYRRPITTSLLKLQNTKEIYRTHVDFIQAYIITARLAGENISDLIELVCEYFLVFRGVPVAIYWQALWMHAVFHDDTAGVDIIAGLVVSHHDYFQYASCNLIQYVYSKAGKSYTEQDEYEYGMMRRHHKRKKLYNELEPCPA